jgi:chondroitin AC lyase
LSNRSQSGSWKEINAGQSGDVLSRDVFTLWINHGKEVHNGGYAYIVAPQITTPEAMDIYRRNAAVLVVANNEFVQAVYHRDLDILGVVLYEAGAFSYEDLRLEADKSCVILIRNVKSGNADMYVSGPGGIEVSVTIH